MLDCAKDFCDAVQVHVDDGQSSERVAVAQIKRELAGCRLSEPEIV
jgi:hypothetical protein